MKPRKAISGDSLPIFNSLYSNGQSPNLSVMKSAYELAMERLNKTSPAVKLTAQQKKELADLDSRCAAKIAEREIGLKSEIGKSAAQGNYEAVEKLQQQLAHEKQSIRAEFEEKKQRVRDGKG